MYLEQLIPCNELYEKKSDPLGRAGMAVPDNTCTCT